MLTVNPDDPKHLYTRRNSIVTGGIAGSGAIRTSSQLRLQRQDQHGQDQRSYVQDTGGCAQRKAPLASILCSPCVSVVELSPKPKSSAKSSILCFAHPHRLVDQIRAHRRPWQCRLMGNSAGTDHQKRRMQGREHLLISHSPSSPQGSGAGAPRCSAQWRAPAPQQAAPAPACNRGGRSPRRTA